MKLLKMEKLKGKKLKTTSPAPSGSIYPIVLNTIVCIKV